MTQSPSIPRSRRNLNDLDSLIDASIGKSDTYGTASSPPKEIKLDTEGGPWAEDKAPASASPEAPDAASPNAPNDGPVLDEPKPERFRISIDASVIMATKMLAVRQKTSPSEIVERALRRYLNLPAD
ncbi:CopG family transcriptional regulator [Rhizobium sp. NPDC090275]|uniref:ribbon-helix-helix domain-containing protein n=1 Tax=Rhizobium sp. NPDC090275 TaxID=3364498 RepID=UPI00383B2F04